MDKQNRTKSSASAYEMLLTLLCQYRYASAVGWCRPVADPARARIDVVTYATAFGDRLIRRLASKLWEYVDLERLRAPLSPLVCTSSQLGKVFQITAYRLNLCGTINGKDVLIWDSGKGSRMGSLVRGGKPKGDLEVWGGHKLYHYSAGAAKWLVDYLAEIGKEYIAFIATDQVVCLSDHIKQQLKSLLHVASTQDADIIFFDGPPVLSLVRLHSLLDPTRRPRKDSLTALARDRTLLKHFGGAHIFQCVLLKKDLVDPLAKALEALLRAAKDGYDLDYDVYDVAILPQLVRAYWLEQDQHPAASKIYSALCDLNAKVENVFPVSLPIQVFNVNTPLVLKWLRKRILRDSQAEEF